MAAEGFNYLKVIRVPSMALVANDPQSVWLNRYNQAGWYTLLVLPLRKQRPAGLLNSRSAWIR